MKIFEIEMAPATLDESLGTVIPDTSNQGYRRLDVSLNRNHNADAIFQLLSDGIVQKKHLFHILPFMVWMVKSDSFQLWETKRHERADTRESTCTLENQRCVLLKNPGAMFARESVNGALSPLELESLHRRRESGTTHEYKKADRPSLRSG